LRKIGFVLDQIKHGDLGVRPPQEEAGEKIEPAKAGPALRVVNLMEALRASIDAEKSVQPRRPAKKEGKPKVIRRHDAC
jgi:hypothetical protein